MIWLKLTLTDGNPTWVNFEAYVEMKLIGDRTVLWSGHIASHGEEVHYFVTEVRETPEEIIQMFEEKRDGD